MSQELSHAAAILQALVRCRSVTPKEGGALEILETLFSGLGFEVHRVKFSDKDTPDVQNLYARLGTNAPHLCFAGHTDVVPAGDKSQWKHDPFAGEISNGHLYGRGAVDMKGGIAAFLAALIAHMENHGEPLGSISFLITGDEEGPAINGTKKLLEWVQNRGEKIDACIVGEPTNPEKLGDAIKIGRRGSMTADIEVTGIQGHVAYPHLADNPVRGIISLMASLLAVPLDQGSENFQPSNIEVTTLDVANEASNVIAQNAKATLNIRFNDNWNEESLKQEVERRLQLGASSKVLRSNGEPVKYKITWRSPVSPVFLTKDEGLINQFSAAVEAVTKRKAELSTNGGTSDARFIKDYCPVIEFGLVGKTMHQVNENVALADLDQLTLIYAKFLELYFAQK